VNLHGVVGKVAHDARLVAAMVSHCVTRLLTFNDQGFARFDEIAVIAPVDAAAFSSSGVKRRSRGKIALWIAVLESPQANAFRPLAVLVRESARGLP
jgi:hypothetical protein